MKRWIKRIAWVGVVLALVCVVGWTAANWWTRRQLVAELALLRQEGYEVTLARVAPAAVPPHQNAARLFEAAGALLLQPSELPELLAGLPEPPPNVTEEDHVDDLLARVLASGPASLTPPERALIDAWLAANQRAFELLQDGARLPKCRWTRDYSRGFEMLLPDLMSSRTLGRYQGVRVLILAASGQHAEALTAWRAGLALAEGYADEPILISQLVRVAMLTQLVEVLEALALDPSTPVETLTALRAALPPASRYDGMFEVSLRGELAAVIELFSQGMPETRHLGGATDLYGVPSWLVGLARPLVQHSTVSYIRRMRRLIELSKAPWTESRLAVDAVQADIEDLSWSDPVTALLMPALSSVLNKGAGVQARLALARVGLSHAIAARGEQPAPAVTARDPFTGKPLRFDARTGRIYSLGENRKDDGGVSEKTGDDIVWRTRRPAPPEKKTSK